MEPGIELVSVSHLLSRAGRWSGVSIHTPAPRKDEFGTTWKIGPSDTDINAAKSLKLPELLRNVEGNLAYGQPCPPTPTTTASTTAPLAKTLTGKWSNNISGWGFKMNDQGDPKFASGSTWTYTIVMDVIETSTGTFTGTMQRTLTGITGPVTTIPEIMKQIGTSQTTPVSGTRKDSEVELKFGDVTLHLKIESDSSGLHLRGGNTYYDTGSPIGQYKGLTDIKPAGSEYITWLYYMDLLRK